jgi:predicted 3-demethylubiquinone-9 3-methyltransferase (glyoxalase superfamily)
VATIQRIRPCLWQVVPTLLADMLTDEKSEKSQRAFEATLHMKKLDIGALQKAYGD